MNSFLACASFLACSPGVLVAQSTIHRHSTPAATYTIQDLSVQSPFPETVIYGISPGGKMTGACLDPLTGLSHALVLSGGVYQDLGAFGYSSGAYGVAINDSGKLAGIGIGPGYHAFYESNGNATELDLSDNGGLSTALAINSAGHVVGRAQVDDGGWQGFIYSGGQVNQVYGTDWVRGINDSDQYCGSLGYSWVQYGYMHSVDHAFISSGGVITDLGSIGGGSHTWSEAYAINNAGQVTGYSTAADGTQHAFLYENGVLSDLGTFTPYWTCGISINNSGTILGTITNFNGVQLGSFVYSNGVMHDFSGMLGSNGAAWSGLTPCQIDDAGWIVGYGTINGATHGFLARPLSQGHLH